MKDKQNLAIVTGCSSGIGEALCLKLLDEGYRVFGWSRSACALDHSNFTHQVVDVCEMAQVRKAYEQIKSEWGVPRVLINNAGLGIFKYFEKLSPEDWNKMMDVNVKGIFNCCHPIVPDMRKEGRGTIVNISSIAGKSGIPEATVYCASKFAVRGFSQALHLELKKFGIRVMCVFPGSVNTDFFRDYAAVNANPSMLDPKEVAESIVYHIQGPSNMLVSEIEIRPLNPDYKG